ncbi:hypothetical protein [Kitasatospora sp. NPDC090091]|uniref:hypothetical protein n=1 Tax=Kitasatospora sp. NPDC090091 TaxID=3364081 RepID=UPI00380B7206
MSAERRHRCPPCCHRCPDLDDEIMPGCMGTAANLGAEHGALTWCTCRASLPSDANPAALIELLTTRVDDLTRRITELEANR